MNGNFGDLKGQKFGILTAVRPTEERSGGGSVIWECKCDCGNTAFINVSRLINGSTKSCGCLRRNPKIKNWMFDCNE